METMEERESKLQAGKDALLAFQKKKDKKTKKKKSSKPPLNDSSCKPLESIDSSITDSIIDPSINDSMMNGNINDTTPDNIQVHPNNNDAHNLLETSLVAMETTLSNREKEIAELKSQHISDIDSLLVQQEKIREELLKEQAMKFAKEMNEMKERTSSRDNDDEVEAMRIKEMKTRLNQLHEQELESVRLTHQREKSLLIEEYQRKMEELKIECDQKLDSNKNRLEEIANDQIKEIHTQFMTSYNEIMTQKNLTDEENRKLQERLQQTEENLSTITEEKRALCAKVEELEASHIMEVDAVRNASSELENRLQKWKEKASHLQQRIEETEKHIDNTDTLRQRMEEQQAASKEIIDKHETTIGELKTHLNEEKLMFESKISELEESHQLTLRQMESQHSEQLENSITESSTQAASLEFAEVHMKELQQQLNAYRNQEMSHKMALEKAQEERTKEVEQMKKIGEDQCDHLRTKHMEELEERQKMIDQLQDKLKRQEDKMAEKEVETNIVIDEAVEKMKEEHGETLRNIHQKEIEELKNVYSKHIASLEQAKLQLESDKQKEIEHIQKQNQIMVRQLKEELQEEQMKSQDSVMMSSEDSLKEVRTLQEKIHKLENEFRANEVQLSLTESELTNEREKHSNTKESLEASTKKYDDVITTIKELKMELEEERETSMKRFEEMLQVKEDEVATHQSRLVSSQLRISELTDELAQEREACNSLKEKIIAITNSNQEHQTEELTRVHDELKQAKERCDTLVEEWKEKESNSEKLKIELSNVQDSLANQNADHVKVVNGLKTRIADLSDRMVNASEENEQLKKKINKLVNEKDELLNQETVLRSQVQILEGNLSTQTIEHKQLLDKEQESLEELQRSKQMVIEELEEVKEHLTMKTTEVDELAVKMNELQVQLLNDSSEDSQRCHDLQSKLQTTQEMLRKTNQEHQQELLQAEQRYMALEKKFNQTQKIESKMNALLNSQSDVEKSLVKARQVLIEKLKQKELLEKDLNHHRTQLERRQSEKQRLEELLFEKSKFEQELRNQREQLQFDLDTIEKKMKSNKQQPNDDSL